MSDATLSAGQLLREGVQHWRAHQRPFWLLTVIALIAILAIRLIGLSGLAVATATTYIILFDQWLKLAMFPDWTQREKLSRKAKAGRRLGYPNSTLWMFGFAYGAVVAVIGIVLFLLISPDALAGKVNASTLFLSALTGVTAEIAATFLFAGNLLILPSTIAGMKWNLGDAFREAQGKRRTLMTLALLATVIAAVGPLLMAANALLLPPGFLILALVLQGLTIIVELFALYLVAYGMTRLFVAITGWQPEPLPAD